MMPATKADAALDALIRARRAAYHAYIAHRDACSVPECRDVQWPGEHFVAHLIAHGCDSVNCGEYSEPTHPCAEHNRLLVARLRANNAVEAAARALGWRSPTEYERAVYGRSGALR